MRILRLFGLILMMTFGGLSLAAEKVWKATDVPIPYLSDSTQYVSDPDGYVDKQQKDTANYYLSRLKWECGVQNVLIIVGHVENQDAFRMAQDVGNRYGVGSKKTRRGLVIVIAVEDHKAFIAPGMGLEGELTDVDCNDIGRACIVKYMKRGKPGDAVPAVSRAIYNKVKKGRTGLVEVDEGTANSEEDWLLILLVLFLCFGFPLYYLVRFVCEKMGWIKPTSGGKRCQQSRRRHDGDDWMPPFFMGGGGSGFSCGGGFSGGSFGGGSFGGGGSGVSW